MTRYSSPLLAGVETARKKFGGTIYVGKTMTCTWVPGFSVGP